MSYQVLARKWRPRTFRELVGQQHVLQALVNALDHNRLHHAYLFTGTRGVGKTTIARILAKCLNCETGVSSEPCGQCPSCVEINEGRFVDLIEVDAASRTKVEDTRELLENVQYAPTRGRYKVYLIDEVHMLSSHSFNALLKTLEEPPPHVKFLLATTDPQKLPVTILSRCLQFHLKNMDPERIVGHLQHVLEQEMVPFDDAALWQLGRAADGSMRDAMSLTDQAIAFGGGKVADTDVRAMLGTIDQNLVYQVLNALVSTDASQVMQAVDQLAQHAPDYSGALAEILSALHRIAIAQALPEAVDNSRGDREQLLQLAQQLAAEDVQLFYQTALMGRRDLPMSPEPRAGFEMVLLRMLAFRPQGVHSVPTQALPAGSPVAAKPSEIASAPGADSSPAATLEPAATPTPVATTPVSSPAAPVPSPASASETQGATAATSAVDVSSAEPVSAAPTIEASAQPVLSSQSPEQGMPTNNVAVAPVQAPMVQTVDEAQRPPWEEAPVSPQPTQEHSVNEVNTTQAAQPQAAQTQAIQTPVTQTQAPEAPLGDSVPEANTEGASAAFNDENTNAANEVAASQVPSQTAQQPQASPLAQAQSVAPDLGPLAADPVDNELQQGGNGLTPDQMSAMGLQSARNIEAPKVAPAPEVSELVKVALAAAEPSRWIEIYAGLGVGGVLQSTVSNCLLQQVSDQKFYFMLDHNHSTLYDPAHQGRLAELLSRYFDQPIEAFIELGTVTEETPAACAARIKQEQYQGALQAMHQDPVVQQLLAQFEGELDQESVQAILPQ
ncbi:MAG: DNA polymerase III subunit gamma/tau [Cellvibrionaceae bacterium]